VPAHTHIHNNKIIMSHNKTAPTGVGEPGEPAQSINANPAWTSLQAIKQLSIDNGHCMHGMTLTPNVLRLQSCSNVAWHCLQDTMALQPMQAAPQSSCCRIAAAAGCTMSVRAVDPQLYLPGLYAQCGSCRFSDPFQPLHFDAVYHTGVADCSWCCTLLLLLHAAAATAVAASYCSCCCCRWCCCCCCCCCFRLSVLLLLLLLLLTCCEDHEGLKAEADAQDGKVPPSIVLRKSKIQHTLGSVIKHVTYRAEWHAAKRRIVQHNTVR